MNYLNRKQQFISLLPLAVLVVALSFSSTDTFAILMISFGYIWNWGICNEKIYERINTNPRYRFSFLRVYSKYGELIFDKVTLAPALTIFVRATITFGLSGIFYLLTGDALSFILPVGTLSFESFKLLVIK